jgi:zinc protease
LARLGLLLPSGQNIRVRLTVLAFLASLACLNLCAHQSVQAALSYTVETIGEDATGTVVPLTKVTYSNGLVALIKESHSSPIVTVDAWCGTGAASEVDSLNGISHFFEHMFFKGTERHPRGEMDKIIKGLGGMNNAGTSVEYTHYYVTVPSENYLVALDVLSDALLHSVFDPEEVTRERDVVKAEIRRKEDTPASKVFVLFQRQFGAGTPYQEPVLGTFESLDRIDQKAFLDYLHEKYTSENVVVVVTGDVNTQEIVKAVSTYFEPIAEGKPGVREFDVKEPTPESVEIEYKDVNRGYMMLGFLTQGWNKQEEYLPLEVAATILGDGKSSRLHQSLVERKKLANSVSAWYWPLRRAGTLGVDATFDPGKEDSVKTAVLAEVERLATAGPTDEELGKAKALLKTSFAFSTETTAGRASVLGSAYTSGMLDQTLEYNKRVDAVTASQVKGVVSKYTSGKHCAVGIILPKKEAEE